MKVSQLLPFATLASALVLPPEQVFAGLEDEQPSTWMGDLVAEKDSILSDSRDIIAQLFGRVSDWTESQLTDGALAALGSPARNLDDALFDDEDLYEDSVDAGGFEEMEWDDEALDGMTCFDAVDEVESMPVVGDEWEDTHGGFKEFVHGLVHNLAGAFGVNDHAEESRQHRGPPHHGPGRDHRGHHPPPPPPHHGPERDHPPHHGPPRHGPPHHGPPHHKPPHHGPRHPHKPRHEPNETLWQLISGSKYTTKLAKLVGKYDDLVSALNSTKHNVTLFAPTDRAFNKIPEKIFDKFSKKQIEHILQYHVVPGVYPAKRVLFTDTAATLLQSESLGSKPLPQRISFRKGFKGISVNFISKVVAVNIFGTNGVIHGVDTPIFPPPDVLQEIQLFPTAFSTLELGLAKTGLLEKLNGTDKADRTGGTLFAPNNWAFEKLGPKVNAFLFSPYGKKYLTALLKYHAVPHKTLYTDAFYHEDEDKEEQQVQETHVELPTALEGHSLGVDIARWGPVVIMKVNGFTHVAIPNGVAEDGVIHVMTSVLIPPKRPGEFDVDDVDRELSVEELVARLEPFVEEERKADL